MAVCNTMKDPVIIERERPGTLEYKEFETPAELNRYFWAAAKKKGSPKLSIAVMSHKNLETLKTCVECVLKFAEGIDYELVLMDNASDDNDETFDYLTSVPYERKIIIKMRDNMGRYFNAARGWSTLWGYCEGDYILHLNDDHFITENAVQNMIRALDSDITVGMVNPMSSNAWMRQDPGLEYGSEKEMFQAAKAFNIYDPRKWEERIYCAAVAWMFRRELRYCLECVNPFGPELSYDVSLRLAGYRVMLLGDTWVHHHHDYTQKESYGFTGEEPEKARQREYIAKSTSSFTFGLTLFDDICVFEKDLASLVRPPIHDNAPTILAVHVRAGQGLLDLKNGLRRHDIFHTRSTVFEYECKYYPLLYTIADDVLIGETYSMPEILTGRTFDYCLVGPILNAYTKPKELLSVLTGSLNQGGQLLFKLFTDNPLSDELLGYLMGLGDIRIDPIICINNIYHVSAIKEGGNL